MSAPPPSSAARIDVTLFHLVRHAPHVLQDRVLVGRMKGVALSETGRAQADVLGARCRFLDLDAIVSSPRRRARETACAIAQVTGAPVEISPGLDEVDFGDWTGLSMDALEGDPRWTDWNARRASARCPGGEDMDAVWARLDGLMRSLHARWPRGSVALVSHAEPIRATVLRAKDLSFDDFLSVAVEPASVTTLRYEAGAMRLTDERAAA